MLLIFPPDTLLVCQYLFDRELSKTDENGGRREKQQLNIVWSS